VGQTALQIASKRIVMQLYTKVFKKFLTLGLLISVLAACGAKLDGTYATSEKDPIIELKFKSNGTVIHKSFMGVETELKYEIEDKSVKLSGSDNAAGKLILKLRDDGSIEYPMLGLLRKKK
jgi:outer membrane lipopolysaccharide assembly protein LptE/RlpB